VVAAGRIVISNALGLPDCALADVGWRMPASFCSPK
jgi:hypothetical protein